MWISFSRSSVHAESTARKEIEMRNAMRCAVFLVMFWMFLGCKDSGAAPPAAQGSDLRSIIENEIRSHVRESWGEYAGENFSDEDLKVFEADRVPAQIVSELKNNKLFLQAVEKARTMAPSEQAAYLKRCRGWLRPTWAEQGKIDRNGTTDAGRLAELQIANAITDYAESLLGISGKPQRE
jgi:hypothetical protein